MSNIFRNTRITYFQFPEMIVVERLHLALSPAALRVYLWLLCEAQRRSKATVRTTNADLGLAPKTADKARRELEKWRLVRWHRCASGYEATLCHPATGEPLSGKQPQASGPGKPTQRLPKGTLRFGRIIEQLTPAEMLHYYESRLEGKKRERTKGGFMVQCLFHADTRPSLKIDTERGVWYCHGCKTGGGIIDFEERLTGKDASIVAPALAAELSQTKGRPSAAESIHSYTDEQRDLLFQVLKYKGKTFLMRQPGPDGKWINNVDGVRDVPYMLPDILVAQVVVIVEGEKDADRGNVAMAADRPQIVFTTAANGAGNWPEEFGQYFQGKYVMVIPDNDEPGHGHARRVLASVKPHAVATKIVHLPVGAGGDLSDYLDTHSAEELQAEMKKVRWERRK